MTDMDSSWQTKEGISKMLLFFLPLRLFQVKMEREQHQREIRDLQDQLSEMHDELDTAKRMEDSAKDLLIEVRPFSCLKEP